MSAPSPTFDPPFDIHLLRGQSLQIINETLPTGSLLMISDELPYNYIVTHGHANYSFQTSFVAAKAADLGITIENPVAHDPAFNRKPDWKITLAAAEPADKQNRIRNFYLIANVQNGTDQGSALLRIHIHNSLEQVWISPYALTVTLNVTCQARLYARFDDDVVAEINYRHRFNITNPVEIAWDSPTPDLIEEDTGFIQAKDIVGIQDITVAATFNGTTQQDSGLIIVSKQLTATSLLRAELVATGGCPGFPKLNEVPNILFLSEGFTYDQEYDFKILVADYVLDLMNKKITSPFNLLKGSINFWMVFVPSRESGATYLGDLAVRQKPNEPILPKLTGQQIPFIENPKNKAISDWGVAHLLYRVGLPVRAERDTTDQAVIDGVFAKWKATTNLSANDLDKLKTNTSLVKSWQRLGERRLADAKDTAFGITINDNTAAEKWADFNEINLDRKRIQRWNLDDFFSNLRDEDNNLIGPTFIQHSSATQIQGKDFDNLVILTAVRRGRSLNALGYMFTTFGEKDTETLIGELTTLRVSIGPTDLPDKLPINGKATTTHELCHSFGLEDEYGESPPFDSYKNKPVDDQSVASWQFATNTEPASSVDWSSNAQVRIDLEVQGTDGKPKIQPYKIKWRYHRIQTCSVVSTIGVTGNQIVVGLQGSQATQFSVNSAVFLRKRKKTDTAYLIFTRSAGPIRTLASIVTPNPLPGSFTDQETNKVDIEITSIDMATDSVTLTNGSDTITVQVEHGQATLLQIGQGFAIRTEDRKGPVLTLFRTRNPDPNKPDTIEKAISPPLTITSIDSVSNSLTLTIPTGVTLSDYMKTTSANEVMIVYAPVTLPEGQRSADYPFAEIISQKVLIYLFINPYAFNTDSQHRELIDDTADNTNIPSSLVPCCSRRKKEIIGLYSGGNQYHGGIYHPAARCMMRQEMIGKEYTELCAVCRYTLINLIDPTKHGDFDADYMTRKIYPD